jgi:hypothetical protein
MALRKEYRSRLSFCERTLRFLRDAQQPLNGRWFRSSAGCTPLRLAGMADCDRQRPLRRSPVFVVGPLLHRGVHTSLTGSIMTAAPFASTWLRSRWNAGKGRCTNGAGFDSRHPVRAFRVKRIAGSFSDSASVVSGSVPQFAEHDRRGEVARLPATFRSYS